MAWPTSPAEQYFGRGQWGHDGTQWRKLRLLFGYTDTLRIRKVEANAVAGTNVLESSAVPAGEIWVVSLVRGWDAISAVGTSNIGVVTGGVNYPLDDQVAPAAGADARFTGSLVLKEGDKLRFTVWGATAGDVLYLIGLGYEMGVS